MWNNYFESVVLFCDLTFNSFSQLAIYFLLLSCNVCQLRAFMYLLFIYVFNKADKTDVYTCKPIPKHIESLIISFILCKLLPLVPSWGRRGEGDGRSDMLRGWIRWEALGQQVGATFCRSRFHLWVLIWAGPAQSSCVRVCVCGREREMAMVSSEKSPWQGLHCTVYHTRIWYHSWMLITVFRRFNYFLSLFWFDSHRSSLCSRWGRKKKK